MTEEKANPNKAATILIPGSLTDFVKALRELIGAVRDASDLIKDGADLYKKNRARKAAKHLNTLSFTPEGSRRHLERLAAGAGTSDDVQAIGELMASTAGDVATSISELGTYRGALRENCGMKAAAKLDEIIYGPAGKEMLRMSLLELVQMGRKATPPPERITAEAANALRMIDSLNQQLAELHDLY
jgi:hypothetical protein